MTNKINDIDVSECEFLECGMCNAQRNCDGYTGIECKYDNENCYYRQLKRLQEENEGLKSLNDFNVQKIEVLQEENIRLKKIKDDFFKQAEISHQAVQDKNKIIEKLETAIQEIKNLAELEVMLDKNSKAFYPANIQRILDEINEVLNDRD